MELHSKKVIFLFLIVFLVSLSSVSAISEVFVQTQDNAIVIEYPKIFVMKQNEDFHLRFHAFNKTDGKLLTNETINCTLNIYDSSGEGILRKENLEFNISHTENDCQNCFGLHILGGNFSEVGSYSYLIRCSNVGIGGVASVGFEVTPLGLSQTTSQGIGSAIYLILMIVLMFVFGFIGSKMLKTENWWILGIFLMFLSSLFLVYNTWLGYEYHRLFTGLADSGMPETIFWIFLALISAGILASVILLFRHWKKVIRYLKKEMKRKDSEDTGLEDWDFEDWVGEEWGPPKGFK